MTDQAATDWEQIIGYSPVKVGGPCVAVSGTGPIDESGEVAHAGDPGAQARLCLARIAARLEAAGAGLEHVVQTRIYLAPGTDWEAVGRAHGEAFGEIRPATTMVRADLLDPQFMVEIDALAWVPEHAG